VAKNIVALKGEVELAGVVGRDPAGQILKKVMIPARIGLGGIISSTRRPTTNKMRIVVGHQQVVRVDRENRNEIDSETVQKLLRRLKNEISRIDGIIIADYGKGVVTQLLIDGIRQICHGSGCWISLDPKPVHSLDISGLSLITPNRKETFELAGISDTQCATNPLNDRPLLEAVRKIRITKRPSILLVTLGELGMLLCQQDCQPIHIPTVARNVFDVSGAGDTVIAVFTLAVVSGASPIEAAVLANQAAGVVVGKRGTSTVRPKEIIDSLSEYDIKW